MTYLILALLALGLGPLLDRIAARKGFVAAAMDGFTFVAMSGIILGHVLPESIRHAGWWALVLAVVGVFGPTIFESLVKGLAGTAHRAALALGILGLMTHAVVDGLALWTGAHGLATSLLALAVVLHRIPAGMTVWWLVRPSGGKKVAWMLLALMATGTLIGYVFAEPLAAHADKNMAGLFQGLMGGALLHVVLHRIRLGTGTFGATQRRAGGVGGLLGIALVAWILAGLGTLHQHAAVGTSGFGDTLLELSLASAPALVIAFVLAGLVQVFLPKATVGWMKRGGATTRSLKGMLFGLPLPICSCGVIPVYRSLVTQGVPLSAALAFLVATPELGLDAILLSWPLLGADMAIARVTAAAILALIVGRALARFGKDGSTAVELPAEDTDGPWTHRLKEAFRVGVVDLFDSTGPWILLGLVIAAVAAPILGEDIAHTVPRWLEVPLFALLGMPVYVCASGATPLVAVFLLKGVSPGAALAFLLTGPATNATTFGILSDLHGKKVALAFAITVALVTIGMGYGVNVILPEAHGSVLAGAADHDHGTPVQWAALGVLVAMLVGSILRQGSRGFVGRVLAWAGEAEEGASCCTAEPEPKKSCCH